jgi:hypothetical protein
MLYSCKRVTLGLDKIPSNTPKGAQIFVTGSFNNWNPGDIAYLMEYDNITQKYQVDLPLGFGNIEYKFTRGDWTTSETDPCGSEMENRTLKYSEGEYTEAIIEGWKDLDPVNCSRVTLIIQSLPENTPAGAQIYLGGDINGWQCDNFKYIFKQIGNQQLSLTLPRYSDKLMYKITRGTWETSELNAIGNEPLQRELVFGKRDTVFLNIHSWADRPLEKLITQTIVIESVPQKTPVNASLFLASNINNWNPVDGKYKFVMLPNGKRALTVSYSAKDSFDYKITRGGWQTVETKNAFEEMENRELQPYGKDTIYIRIATWIDDNKIREMVMKQEAKVNEIAKQTSRTALPLLKQEELAMSNIPVPKQVLIDYDKRKKVIVIIDRIPDFGKNNTVYMAGDFNDWVENDANYAFRNLPNGKKYFVLRLNDANAHEFKLTRGSWDKEEADEKGIKFNNRNISGGIKDDTLRIQVQRWFDETDQQQLVVLLTATPANTPIQDQLYLTGDFNDWQANEEQYKFKRLTDGKYVLTISDFSKRYNWYKITRGNWDNEASTGSGRIPGNQSFKTNGKDTIRVRIERWKDL